MYKTLTKEQAIQKLKHYCLYQERSHYEVQQKLMALRVPRKDHDEIIAALIQDDYLNEERFAKQYVGGKFRMNGWGKRKILAGLNEKRVSPYVIKVALKEIDEEDYQQALRTEAEKKYELLKDEQYLVRKKKTMDYLLQKGYETDLVMKTIASVIKEN